MNDLTEIKAKLELLFQAYQQKKKGFEAENIKAAANLIAEMAAAADSAPQDAAAELVRFPSKVLTALYKGAPQKQIPFQKMDSILLELYAASAGDSNLQNSIAKDTTAVTEMFRCYPAEAAQSKSLPQFVVLIGRFVAQHEKNRGKFLDLITGTAGRIYLLDYSGMQKDDLEMLRNVTAMVCPDAENAEYAPMIAAWDEKYGFSHAKECKPETPAQPDLTAVLTAQLEPVRKAVEALQGEVEKSREIGAANAVLRAQEETLERQLAEQKAAAQNADQALAQLRTEYDALKQQFTVLEAKNAELDGKLNDAYALNSREASLEAEKIRKELQEAFAFLYEDWLEYEYSDVSEANYESLQAIIKKSFRALERNGISFKGNQT